MNGLPSLKFILTGTDRKIHHNDGTEEHFEAQKKTVAIRLTLVKCSRPQSLMIM
jgi:hypothetical protein